MKILYLGFDQGLVCRVVAGTRDDHDWRAPLRQRGGDKGLKPLHGELDLQTVQVDGVVAIQLIAIGVNGGEPLCRNRAGETALK